MTDHTVVQVEQQWCFHNAEVSQIARSWFESLHAHFNAFSDRSLTEQCLKWRLCSTFLQDFRGLSSHVEGRLESMHVRI